MGETCDDGPTLAIGPTAAPGRGRAVAEVFGRGIAALGRSGAAVVPVPFGRGDLMNLGWDRARVAARVWSPCRRGDGDLQPIDPRGLLASQPSLLPPIVHYYTTGAWERTGTTCADRLDVGNRYPVVWDDGTHRLILAGHHRAAAALVEGRPLLARVVAPGPAGPTGPLVVTPTLLVGEGPTPSAVPVEDAVLTVQAGRRALVSDAAAAAAVLRRLGLAEAVVNDRLRRIGEEGA